MRQALVAILVLLIMTAPVGAQERAIPLVNYNPYCASGDSCVINLEEEPITVQYFHNCGTQQGQIFSRDLVLNQGSIYVKQELANGSLETKFSTFSNVFGQDEDGRAYSVKLTKQIIVVNNIRLDSLVFIISDQATSLEYVHVGFQTNSVHNLKSGNSTNWDCNSPLGQ